MHDIIRHLFKNKIICVSYDKKMTLHKDSTNLDVAIIYHLCQEKNLSDSPKFLGRLRLKQIFGGDNILHTFQTHSSLFSHWIFSCPETTMTDYYKDVVVNNHKLDDLSNYHYLLEHVNINIICTCEFFMSRNNNDWLLQRRCC